MPSVPDGNSLRVCLVNVCNSQSSVLETRNVTLVGKQETTETPCHNSHKLALLPAELFPSFPLLLAGVITVEKLVPSYVRYNQTHHRLKKLTSGLTYNRELAF